MKLYKINYFPKHIYLCIYREIFFFPKKDNISFFSCPDGLGFIWLMLRLSLDESEKWKSCQIICDPMDYTVLGSLQGRKNTGVGSLSLPQGIFPTQRSNPGLPHCRQILYQLSHQGSPRILEWVAYPFSRGYSWPRKSPVLQAESLPAELPGEPPLDIFWLIGVYISNIIKTVNLNVYFS